MPRQSKGPQLRLFGPDAKYGAKAKSGYTSYKWYIVDRVDGRRVERATGFGLDDRPAALKQLAKYANQTTPAPSGGLTVGQALGIYARQHLHKNGKASLKTFLDRFPNINEGLGAIEVEAIGQDHIDSYMNWRRETGVLGYRRANLPRERVRDLSDSTLRRELTDLRAALRFCHRIGQGPACPHFDLPAETEGTIRWLTHSEAARLMRAARGLPRARWHLPLFINISLWTAQRKSAVLGLQWTPNEEGGHVDLERGVMHFPPEGKVQTKKRKTRCVIPSRCKALLQIAYARKNTHVIERPGRPHERLPDIRKPFERACQDAGLEMTGARRVVPHTLGHTAITWMLERGLSAHEVSRFTGKSVQIIQDRYGHHSDELLTRVARGR